MTEYQRGGCVPGAPQRIALDPEECVIRASDARARRWVCCRPTHEGRACHGEPVDDLALIPRKDTP